jgi:hypothetical protein
MNISEVSTAEKKAVERDKGKADIAVAGESLAVGGMGFAGGEDRCACSGQAIYAM